LIRSDLYLKIDTKQELTYQALLTISPFLEQILPINICTYKTSTLTTHNLDKKNQHLKRRKEREKKQQQQQI